MQRILILDDDIQYLESFQKSLNQVFEITCLENEKAFLELCRSGEIFKFDLLIIDLFLAEYNGVFLLSEAKSLVRKELPPVVILTDHPESDLRLDALKDDFFDVIAKSLPIEVIELKLKKVASSRKAQIQFENLEFNLEDFSVRLDGVELDLTKIEFRVLRFVIDSKFDKLSKAEFIEKVWSGRKVVSHSLNTHLYNLNLKLKNWPYQIIVEQDYVQLVPRS